WTSPADCGRGTRTTESPVASHSEAAMRHLLPASSLTLVLAVASSCVFAEPAPSPMDTLVFGAPDSERAHALSAVDSDTITGGLGESARRLLPQEPVSWEGGRASFAMKVDPQR